MKPPAWPVWLVILAPTKFAAPKSASGRMLPARSLLASDGAEEITSAEVLRHLGAAPGLPGKAR